MAPSRTPTEDELALADGLFRAMRLFKAVATSAAQSSDIGSLERAGMLFRLKTGACRPGTLAQHGTRSPSAVTEIVEGLERDGLVRRESDPDDRRAVRVALTADGRRLIQRYENAAALALAPSQLPSLKTPKRESLVRPAGAPVKRVALLLGCVQDVLEPSINQAAIRLLRRHGVVQPMPKLVSEGEVHRADVGQDRIDVDLVHKDRPVRRV